MKNILLFLIVLLCSSCGSTYYFATLDTLDRSLEKVENGDFFLETDSLWVAYCFKGEDAPIQITVFNKSDVPLYIDWNRSALIIDNEAITYAGEKFNYSESIINQGYIVNRSVSLNISENRTFIPPNTMVSEIPIRISPNFGQVNKSKFRNSFLGNKANESISVKRIDFVYENSPLKFTSYLTIYAQPDKPMVFNQDFYLQNLIKTTLNPSNLEHNMIDRGDFFYVEKPANNTVLYTALGIICLAGATFGVAYGDATISEDTIENEY